MYMESPKAIIAVREDEALTHGQVLYGLVKPTKKLDQVESTAAMVNVIPKKRTYRMEGPEEVDLFMSELLKRPLVLQPSGFIGRGLAAISCTVYTKEERWILLVNQTHPKILSRLQKGVESAKMKMSRGEPFMLEISLNAFLKRVYLSSLTKAVLDKRFTFIDFEGADIVIRYPGDKTHRGIQWEIKASNKIHLEFEDLLPGEITRRTLMDAQRECSSPVLRVIMPVELSALLPGWTFEMIDPMEGVIVPEEEEELEGATGGYEVTPEDVILAAPVPKYDRVVGRAKRKANIQAGVKLEIPVELHAAEDEETPPASYKQIVGRARRKEDQAGSTDEVPVELHAPVTDRPTNLYTSVGGALPSPSRGRMPSANQPYEKLNRGGISGHPYSDMSGQSRVSRSPGSGQVSEAPYEVMNISQQHSPHGTPSAGTPLTPNGPHNFASPQATCSDSRYNTEPVNKSSSQQTYLTDDDDGGFSRHAPRSPHSPSDNSYRPSSRSHDGGMSPHTPRSLYVPSQKYDSNYNQTSFNRYGDKYDTNSRYASQETSRQGQSRQGYPVNSERNGPVPAPRGFHRHQGSGRSDTSASDSGFGENENGHDSHSSLYGPGYSNQAYQDDSADHHGNRGMIDDIMARHKAMAASLMDQSGSGVPKSNTRQDYHSDPEYNKELQKWRQNISDLEQAYDTPKVTYPRSRLRTGSNEEKVEESFI